MKQTTIFSEIDVQQLSLLLRQKKSITNKNYHHERVKSLIHELEFVFQGGLGVENKSIKKERQVRD